MAGNTLTFTCEFELQSCINCGCRFAVPRGFTEERRKDHRIFWCPNGHSMSYGENEKEKQIREANAENLRKQAELNEIQHALRVTEKKLLESEAARKQIEIRVSAGTCPCCNRTFKDLARHMKTKHKGGIGAGKKRKEIAA